MKSDYSDFHIKLKYPLIPLQVLYFEQFGCATLGALAPSRATFT